MTSRMCVHRFAVLSLATFALAWTLAAAARSQLEPLFEPPLHPAVGNLRGSAADDLNEDGLNDLLVWGSGSPAVLFGQQGAGLSAPVSTGLTGATNFRLADLDHDGHLDLVGVNAFDDVVGVFAGNGDGTFQPAVNVDSAPDLRSVTVADFDGDGHLDLAAAGLHNFRVAINLGHGDGTFGPRQDYGPIGDYALGVAAADLTGDGVLDLAVSSADDAQVSLLIGVGDGSFTGAPPVVLPSGVEDVGPIDLDDDGDLDLVVLMGSGNQLRLVLNQGGGAFATPGAVVALPSSVTSNLVVADFDENGRDDVAVGDISIDSVVVFRTTGLPGAAALQLVGNYLAGRNPQHLSCADMDGDGDLDLISSLFETAEVRILRGEGDGSFRTAPGAWALGASTLGLVAGDLNEDGRVDLVTCGDGPALSVSLNMGDGRFPTSAAWPVPDSERLAATIADFNGDGHLDVATADEDPFAPGATIVLGAGNGQPLEVKTFELSGAWSWIDAADFDDDGDLDLVLSGDGPWVAVAFNDGEGDLSAGPKFSLSPFIARGVCARDFDGDGAQDFAVAQQLKGFLVFLGDGAGGFARSIETESVGGRGLAAADFDRDGVLDLAVTEYNGQAAVHLGLGDGSFGSATQLMPVSTDNPHGVAAADLDYDGNVDLVTANNHQFGNFGSLSVLIGNGDGSFQPAVKFRTGRTPWHVIVADFDGDGWNDLATAADGGPDVLLNRRGPWNELYHGLAGTQGIPRQTGIGTLVPGQPFAFQLRDGKPLTTAFHVVGISPLNHAFKGGVMVPSIDFINGFPFTNAQGNVTLAGPWIAAPSGLTLYFQFWQKDPAGPFGFSASTAISGTTP